MLLRPDQGSALHYPAADTPVRPYRIPRCLIRRGGFETRPFADSHKIAQYICLTAPSGSIIGEMVVSNCARRLAGRIFLSRTIRAASTRAVQRDQRAGLMHHLQLVLLINIRRYVELTAENYETKPTILAKTNPIQRRPSVAGRPRE